MIQLSNIHVMLRRLAPTARPSFNYRTATQAVENTSKLLG
jgi:hypothetical protein